MPAILNLKMMNNNLNLKAVTVKTCQYHEYLSDIQYIRSTVFIQEQDIPEELEWDNLDAECLHFLAYYNNKAIATARLLKDGHIGRMAVLANFRQQKVGQKLLTFIIKQAQSTSLKIQLSAQEHAVGFYLKQGFRVTSDVYMDAGIPHYDMQYKPKEKA